MADIDLLPPTGAEAVAASWRAYERTLGARMYRAVTRAVGGMIGLVSPERAVGYTLGRQRYEAIRRRAYAAGRMTGPNAKWRPGNKSADAEIRMDAKRVLARARDLERNNAQIHGAVKKIVQNVVNQGIWPQVTVDWGRSKSFASKAEALWHRWAPRADASGYGSLYLLQVLALRHFLVDGEVLVHEVLDPRDRTGMPLRFELLECDRLDETYDGQVLANGNSLRRGIELSPSGVPVAYYILDSHPGDYAAPVISQATRRIPAAHIKHLFLRTRAGQTRGISGFASVLPDMWDLDEYSEYEMIGAKLAAAFSVYVTQTTPGMGGVSFDPGKPGAGNGEGSTRRKFVEPGIIAYLQPGEQIQTASHNRPGATYEPFIRSGLRTVSTGLGMSFETFSNDYSQSTFSSARQALLEERRSYRMLQGFLCEQLNAWIYSRFLAHAYLAGALPMPDYPARVLDYETAVTWVCPGWEWIDPLKDAKASETKIALGISTRTREAAAQGADFEENVQALKREEELLRKAGVGQGVQQSAKDPAPDQGAGDPAKPSQEATDAGQQ